MWSFETIPQFLTVAEILRKNVWSHDFDILWSQDVTAHATTQLITYRLL